MAKQKKVRSISQVFNLAIFIPGGLMALTLLGGLLFAILYAYNHSPALLFVLAGYVIVMVILYSFICANIVNRMKIVFKDGLYGSTDQLIKDLGSNQPSNVRYPEGDIKELKQLLIDKLK
jgi:vacuolar-type H+-ATPase subunit I/STV1